MSTVTFRVSLYADPDETRELVVHASTYTADLCRAAAALFDDTRALRFEPGAVTFSIGGEPLDGDSLIRADELVEIGDELVLGYRPLNVTGVLPSA